jgi:hypothetical protein
MPPILRRRIGRPAEGQGRTDDSGVGVGFVAAVGFAVELRYLLLLLLLLLMVVVSGGEVERRFCWVARPGFAVPPVRLAVLARLVQFVVWFLLEWFLLVVNIGFAANAGLVVSFELMGVSVGSVVELMECAEVDGYAGLSECVALERSGGLSGWCAGLMSYAVMAGFAGQCEWYQVQAVGAASLECSTLLGRSPMGPSQMRTAGEGDFETVMTLRPLEAAGDR